MLAHGETENVGKDVVANHQKGREDKPKSQNILISLPNKAVVDVGEDAGGRDDDDHEGDVGPAKSSELVLVEALLQAEDEDQKSDDPQAE